MNTSIKLINEELARRGVLTEVVSLSQNSNIVYFEYQGKQHAIKGTVSDLSAATGRLIADDKQASFVMAGRLGVSTPATIVHEDFRASAQFLSEYGQIVVKPLDASHGNGVTTAITNEGQLKAAIRHALTYSRTVLLQQQVSGADLRVLVINGEAVAVSERVPAFVVGDGVSSVKRLIRRENENPLRGEYYEKPLNKINETIAAKFLGRNGSNAVPEAGERVQVVGTANIGSGGYAINRTGQVPEALLQEATKLASAISLFACGVDFIYDETAKTWYFIEANGSPSFGLHIWPTKGDSIDVVSIFVDELLKRYRSI